MVIGHFESRSQEPLTAQERMMLYKVGTYFQDRDHLQTLLDMVVNRGEISMRTLEWFVVNYSQRHQTSYRVLDRGQRRRFRVYDEYRSQMGGYSKEYFDPFRRPHRVTCTYYDKRERYVIESSIGQLNYLCWVDRNGILIYLRRHLDEVTRDMRDYQPEEETDEEDDDQAPVAMPSLSLDDNIPHLDLSSPTPTRPQRRRRERSVTSHTECTLHPGGLDIF